MTRTANTRLPWVWQEGSIVLRGQIEGVEALAAFEYRLRQLYQRFEDGQISLGYFANELGLGVRELYAALESRGLATSNMGARPSGADAAKATSGAC